MNLSHQIRLDPTQEQEAYFRRACGTARFTYNWALAEWKKQYEAGEKPNALDLKKQFNAIRGEQFPWTYEVHRDCTSQPFANVQRAFSSFFKKKAKFPKFKKLGQHDSFYLANDQFALKGESIRVPKLGWVRMREPLRFDGKILGATVSRVADRWMLAIQVDVGDYRKPRTADGVVGVDLGVTTMATLSTGEKIAGPKALRRGLKRLQRLSRWHSRKQKGSANRRKSALRLARLHCRIADVRRDAMHQLTTRLCRENQAVGIEDLNVRGMLRNHHLARSIGDAGFGEFRRQMEYKKHIFGTELRVADRWYPSSKQCHVCGVINHELKLSDRVFHCASCGTVEDRDVNAAKNLGAACPEVTPVESVALVESKDSTKLPTKKQELARDEHLCSLAG